jgi:hypothetical protein
VSELRLVVHRRSVGNGFQVLILLIYTSIDEHLCSLQLACFSGLVPINISRQSTSVDIAYPPSGVFISHQSTSVGIAYPPCGVLLGLSRHSMPVSTV